MSGLIKKSRLPSFHNSTPTMYYGFTTSASPVTLLNVSGKGYLSSLSIGSTSDSQGVGLPSLALEIDGVAWLSSVSGWSSPAPIVPLVRFETSLVVKLSIDAGHTAFFNAAYNLD